MKKGYIALFLLFIIPLSINSAKKTKIYFESYFDNGRDSMPSKAIQPVGYNANIEFVKTKEAADVIILWLKPTASVRGLFGSKGDPIDLSLSKNRINVDYVNSVMASKPTILAINFTNPWVINEVDKGNAKTIIATFGTTPDAVLDVVTGAFKPSGKMPFTVPVSQKVVEENQSDVPGFMKPAGYALFKFGDGLSY